MDLTPAQELYAAKMTEGELQAVVERTLSLFRWEWFHDRDPRRNRAGLPDLIAARGGQVLLIELKSAKGKPSPAQLRWAAAAGGVHRFWRPRDWYSGEVVTALT